MLALRSCAVFLMVAGTFSVFADVRLPLDSVRSHGTTEHSWAYATAHLLESRVQARWSESIVLDVERDLRFGQLYLRFFQRYKNRKPLAELEDAKLLTEAGFAAEYLSIFLSFGVPIFKASPATPAPHYPDSPGLLIGRTGFVPAPRPNLPPVNASALIRKLDQITDDQEASRLILQTLGRSNAAPTTRTTRYFRQEMPVGKVPSAVLRDDYAGLLGNPLVFVILPGKEGVNTWGTYFGGKFLSFSANPEQMRVFTRKSLDLGMPVLEVLPGHVATIIGCKGGEFARADSRAGSIRWVPKIGEHDGIYVFKSVIESVIPPHQALPQGERPRPHRGRPIRIKD